MCIRDRCTEDSGGADKFRSPDLCGKKNLRSALWRADSGADPMWSDWLSKECPGTVSYTHLDVYKRQQPDFLKSGCNFLNRTAIVYE